MIDIFHNHFKNRETFKMGDMVTRSLLAFDDGYAGYTLNKFYAEKGADGPMHSHHHKQVMYILRGSGLFSSDGIEFNVYAGDVIEISPNEAHTFLKFYEDTEWLEFFTPHRDDFRPQGNF